MFNSPQDIRSFVLAGNAIVTLESEKTGRHYTYRVCKADNANRWFVKSATKLLNQLANY